MSILQFIVFFAIFIGFSNAGKYINYKMHNNQSDYFYGPLYFGSNNVGNVNATIALDLLSSYTVVSSTFSEECPHKYYNQSESIDAVNQTNHPIRVKHNEDWLMGYEV